MLRVQARLNALLPGTFPLHACVESPPLALPQPNMAPGRNLLRYHLRPKRDEPLDDGEAYPCAHALHMTNTAACSVLLWYTRILRRGCAPACPPYIWMLQ